MFGPPTHVSIPLFPMEYGELYAQIVFLQAQESQRFMQSRDAVEFFWADHPSMRIDTLERAVILRQKWKAPYAMSCRPGKRIKLRLPFDVVIALYSYLIGLEKPAYHPVQTIISTLDQLLTNIVPLRYDVKPHLLPPGFPNILDSPN